MKNRALKNIAQIWRKKQLIKAEVDEALGKYDLSNTAKDIFIYITANKANISSIMHNPYFADKSISTIKRAVLELKQCNLIKPIADTVDKRVMWLQTTEE